MTPTDQPTPAESSTNNVLDLSVLAPENLSMETIWYGKCPFCGVVYPQGQAQVHKRSPEHFWGQVDRSGECWVWTGNKYPNGYGHASGKYYAHRRSWEFTNGLIPDGLWVLHHCDNRPCVRPDHLFLGTAKDNAEDRDRKGRNGMARRRRERAA